MRQDQVKYEVAKDSTKREIKSAKDEQSKGAAKDKLKKLKKDWKGEKKQFKDRIKSLKGNK